MVELWRGCEHTPCTKDPLACLAGVKKLGSVTFSKACPHITPYYSSQSGGWSRALRTCLCCAGGQVEAAQPRQCWSSFRANELQTAAPSCKGRAKGRGCQDSGGTTAAGIAPERSREGCRALAPSLWSSTQRAFGGVSGGGGWTPELGTSWAQWDGKPKARAGN